MTRLKSVVFACTLSTMPAWLGCGVSGARTENHALVLQHNSSLPYRAWTFVLDKSRSPRPEQFQKMKRVAELSVEADVQSNDLAWLIPIDSTSGHATIFPIAPMGLKRSEKTGGGGRLRESKNQLTGAIAKLEQAAARTDLGSAIELSLNILQGQLEANEKYAVFGSDFVDDTAQGRMSLDPPSAPVGLSASGVHVILLVAIPKDEYLRALHVSASVLFHSVAEKYRRHFEKLGAQDVSVQLLDAVPVAAIGGSPLLTAAGGLRSVPLPPFVMLGTGEAPSTIRR